MPKSTKPVILTYRSAVTGQYVTQRQAERNPRETVRETRPAPAAPTKGGRK